MMKLSEKVLRTALMGVPVKSLPSLPNLPQSKRLFTNLT
jgi:hypothetical protein